MLQRHVNVLHQRLMFGDGVEQALGDFVRIGVKKTNPLGLFGGKLGETREQVGKPVLEAQIFAVTSGVLADEIDFANSRLEHALSFRDDAFETAAAELATKLRNDAEGAGMIAPFGDFDIGGMARRGEYACR